VLVASAERLPFADGAFTAIAMSVVFFFFADPVAVLCESLRVSAPGARLAVYTTAPELRGTPAAPEPLASRGHFHSDDELVSLAEAAGWERAEVRSGDGGQLLTAVANL
jgi:SAM-dependent methyltransferase